MNIAINVENNKNISDTIFPEGSVIGKNCEFINCEFKKDCKFNENCKFTNCKLDKDFKFDRGCEFKQCTFGDVLVSYLRINLNY